MSRESRLLPDYGPAFRKEGRASFLSAREGRLEAARLRRGRGETRFDLRRVLFSGDDSLMKEEGRAMPTKVFCIGGPKTGTTSLAHALRLVGFRHKTWDRELWLRYKQGDLAEVFRVADVFDSFDDGPWNNDDLYVELDNRFPGSKFILTDREPVSWIRSHESHFTARQLQLKPYRLWRRRYSEAEKREKIQRFQERNERIRRYFEGRPGVLLEMNVCAGEGWEKLCPFLGVISPTSPFPAKNVTAKIPKTTYHVWRRILRDWFSRFAGRGA